LNSLYDYSILTEGIIVFTWAVPAWFMYITFRESGRSKRSAWIAFSVPLLWAALAWYLTKADISWGDSPLFQARPLIIMVLSVCLTIVFARKIVGPGLNQKWLTGLQLFRVIGMLFVLEWARGNRWNKPVCTLFERSQNSNSPDITSFTGLLQVTNTFLCMEDRSSRSHIEFTHCACT